MYIDFIGNGLWWVKKSYRQNMDQKIFILYSKIRSDFD